MMKPVLDLQEDDTMNGLQIGGHIDSRSVDSVFRVTRARICDLRG
jgi:hypothetical protein